MASKLQHVQDNSVIERRLRPIYDWLDSGNNKKALQECDKVLKKTPNLLCVKALKALTLLRMGKENDSIQLLDILTIENPTDDHTLQAMSLCYREMQQLEKICKLYENAVKHDPTNEELHTHLFMSYVRIGDFKSQQQSAMTLYKHKAKNPYYCWAVMSIILQAIRGDGKTDVKKRTLLLSLAERMMVKLISENKLEAEQEVQLYVMVLDLLEKYEEIMTVIEGPLGEKLVCSNSAQNKLKYLIKLKKWHDVNLVCKGILANSINEWDIWKEYINSVIELMAVTPTDQQNQTNNHIDNHECGDNDMDIVDDSPEKAHEFICRLVENGAENGYLLRGPYLARFLLCQRLMEKNIDTTDLLGETIELFIEYFRKFGHKSCCVSDLMIFLNLLDQEKRLDLSSRLMKDVGISSTSVPQSRQQLEKHICALQLSRLAGTYSNFSPDHLKALVTALSLHYQHGYQTYGSNLLSTDLGPSDSYALLAAHILYDLAQIERSSKSLVCAVVLLQSLLTNSPSNSNAKLLCVRLYHTIGAGLGAQDMYNSLDVKHLQLDTLGYIHCGRLQTTGLFSLCTNLYDTTLKFFSSNYKDSSDHLTFTYKFGSFLKLDEIMDFRERLNNSLHYTSVAIDRIILSLMQCTNSEGLYNLDISPKDNKIEWDLLRDNHDLRVYLSWDPQRTVCSPEDSPEIKLLFEQDISFLKLRTQILWALSASVEVVKSIDGTRTKHLENLKIVLEEWDFFHKKVSSDNRLIVPINQNQITLPLPSRLHLFLSSPYLSLTGKLFRILANLASDQTSEVNAIHDEIKEELDKLIKYIENTINVSSSDLQESRAAMEFVVNNVEVLCISSLVCLLCNDLIKPAQGKKGKRKTSNQESNSKVLLTKIVNDVKSCINNLDTIIQSWAVSKLIIDVNSKLDSLNLNVDGSKIFDHIGNTHTTATKEIQTILKSKVKLLNSLIG